MSDTDTQVESGPPVPSPIFTPDDTLDELWVRAYQGEVLGEALFGRIADRLDDERRAATMRVLATLERRTKEAIAPALERAGLPTAPDPEMATLAEALAVDMPWEDFLGATEAITAQYIPLYRRLGELDPSEQDDLGPARRARGRAARLRPRRARRRHHDLARGDQRAGPHALTGLR